MKLIPILSGLLIFAPMGAAPTKKAPVRKVKPAAPKVVVIPQPVLDARFAVERTDVLDDYLVEACKTKTPYAVYQILLRRAKLLPLLADGDRKVEYLAQSYIDVLEDWGRGLKVE